MNRNKSIWLFALLAFLLPALAYLLVSWYEDNKQSLPVYGGTVEVNGKEEVFRISPFAFINQDNQVTGIQEDNEQVWIINTFFTHCPVICPRMTAGLKKVEQAFENDDAVVLASLSVDPERDTVGQLQWYSRHFNINNHRWQLFTGSKKAIYRYARNDLKIVATDGDGGYDDFIHSESAVLIDRQRRIRGYYNATAEKAINQLIADIKKLKNEK